MRKTVIKIPWVNTPSSLGVVHDLADLRREADFALAVVVRRGDLRMAQKPEELVPVFLCRRDRKALAGMARLAARFFLPAGLLPGLGGGLEMRRNHPGRGGGRGRGRLQMPGDFQEQKDERFLACGQDPLREETGLLFPEGGAGVEQFGENLRDDRRPVLFHTS